MSKLTIEECARRSLYRVPGGVSGSGGHNQTYAAACHLIKGYNLSIDEARPLMQIYNKRCKPQWVECDLEHKLIDADLEPDKWPRGWLLGAAGKKPIGKRLPRTLVAKVPPKPCFSPEKLEEFAKDWSGKVTLSWLADRSPVEPALVTAHGFLTQLYHDGENVVVFTDQVSQGQAIWPTDKIPLTGPDGVWFLAQPVDGTKRYNQRGKLSRRSKENVTSWRFLVIESDEADFRSWMGALVQLPLRIVAIYTSGKRSIHALVRVDTGSKAEWDEVRDRLKEPLVVLGADQKSLSAVRLTRLPGCIRRGKPQKLLYFNPEPLGVPICELPALRDVLGYWLGWHEALIGVIQNTDDCRAPADFLRALAFYSRSDPRCEAAANYWQQLASGSTPSNL